jgi:hypothetical protein
MRVKIADLRPSRLDINALLLGTSSTAATRQTPLMRSKGAGSFLAAKCAHQLNVMLTVDPLKSGSRSGSCQSQEDVKLVVIEAVKAKRSEKCAPAIPDVRAPRDKYACAQVFWHSIFSIAMRLRAASRPLLVVEIEKKSRRAVCYRADGLAVQT